MESGGDGMRYDEWQAGVPNEIKGDSLWKLEVYRLGLFISDISWQDALELGAVCKIATSG